MTHTCDGWTVDRVEHRVLRLTEPARWLEPPLGAVPSQDQRRDQRAEPQLVGVLPHRRARRRRDAGHPRRGSGPPSSAVGAEGRASTTTRSTTAVITRSVPACSRNRRPPCTSPARSRRPRARRRSCPVGSRFAVRRHVSPSKVSTKGRLPPDFAPKYGAGTSCPPTATQCVSGDTRSTVRKLSPFSIGGTGEPVAHGPAGRPHRERHPDRVPAARRARRRRIAPAPGTKARRGPSR